MTACLRPDWPAPANVRALVTLRDGGTSTGPYASLNLAGHVGDRSEAVATNRAKLRETQRLPSEPCWLEQVHGNVCIRAERSLPSPPVADAAWTGTAGVVCAVLTADCLPILLCDRAGTSVAAVHAGWRGLAGGVIANAVRCLTASTGLLAWIGPGIGPPAYRVDDGFRERFLALEPGYGAAFSPHADGWHCDLGLVALLQLHAAGVREVSRYAGCCHAEPERFFSHRRDGVCGRFASLIWLA